MVNHPVDPHPIIQSLLVALAGLDDIPMSYQEAAIAVLDNIPDTKPETPEQTQDRISRKEPPVPWRSKPSTLANINKIKRLFEVNNTSPQPPWPTLEEYKAGILKREQNARLATSRHPW